MKYLSFLIIFLFCVTAEGAPDITGAVEALPGTPDVPDYVPDCVVRAFMRYMMSYMTPDLPKLPDPPSIPKPDVDLPSVPKGKYRNSVQPVELSAAEASTGCLSFHSNINTTTDL